MDREIGSAIAASRSLIIVARSPIALFAAAPSPGAGTPSTPIAALG
jgi:hypothetical protein